MRFPISHKILSNSKSVLTDRTMNFILEQCSEGNTAFQGFPQTEPSVDFCKRDITFVIEALMSGLESGNSTAIEFIASRYWRGNQSVLIGDREKEIQAHRYLKQELIRLFHDHRAEEKAITKVSNEYEYLIKVISYGPKKQYFDDLLSTRFTCKHWQDVPVPTHLIEYIADCAYLAPSKLGCREFLTVLITDSPRGKEIKNWLYYGHTFHSKGDRGRTDKDSPRGYNGQYLAPLVVAWLNPFGDDEKTLIKSGDVYLEAKLPGHGVRKNDIFISSMCAMIAAEEQGLNTGFGSCHDHIEAAKMLGFEGYDCPIMIGVGYAKDMTKEEEKHGVLIPVYDPADPSNQIGYDATNFQQGHPGCVNRINRRPKHSVTITI